MVTTMAGIQEARRTSAGSPTRLISAMTAAFALGQLAGPIVVGLGSSSTADAIALPSIAAALLLVVSALALSLTRDRAAQSPAAVQR